MRRLLDLAGSLRLTLVLLLALAALFATGLLVPQKAVLRKEGYERWRGKQPEVVAALEWAGLTDVHRSPLAAGVWVAFFTNLSIVMARRVPVTLRRVRGEGRIPEPQAGGFSWSTRLSAAPGDLVRARGWFERKGYTVRQEGNRFLAVRNRLAPIATLGFHLSFLLIAAGAAASTLTRFTATVDLGEGEEYTGALEQYAGTAELPRIGAPPRARFTVERIEPEMVGEVPVRVRVIVRDPTFALHTLEVNRPYRAAGASFVFRDLGVAPALVLTDPNEEVRFSGLMRLNVLQGRTDRFTVAGLTFAASFFPDYAREGDKEWSRTQEMLDPVLRLAVTASGRPVGSAALRPGETATFGPYKVAFLEWRYWTRIYVRAERGIWLIWLGFGLGLAALAIRLFFYRREYVVGPSLDGAGLMVAARAEYYRALFADEAAAVAGALERELQTPSDALTDR